MAKNNNFRVGIIGAGPGGGILATYLSRAGIDTTIIEKATFPRYHIGESLNPAVMYILNEIGVTEELLGKASCARKYKIMWTLPRKEFSYVLEPVALHVERSRFDEVILNQATTSGAKLINAKVIDVDLDSIKPKITYQTADSTETLEFDYVVDCSGRATILATKLNRVERIPEYDHIAVHARFKNYEIPNSETENTVLHYLQEKEGWCWQFPIGENLYSVGVVIPRKKVSQVNNLEDFFWESIQKRPDICQRLKDANCISEFKTDANYSYRVKKFYGNNFAMIGDASGYIDPIFSAGIGVASHGAKFLAQDLINIAQNNLIVSEENISTFTTKMNIGFHNWRNIIFSYYRLQVAMTYFLVHTDHASLVRKLLNGELYDQVQVELIAKIKSLIASVENSPNHPWHSFLGKDVPNID